MALHDSTFVLTAAARLLLQYQAVVQQVTVESARSASAAEAEASPLM